MTAETCMHRSSAATAPAAVRPAELQPSQTQPWLVADIGGTNARMALVRDRDGTLTDVRVLATAGHHQLSTLLQAYFAEVGVAARRGCVALAGPIVGDRCRATNAALEFSIRDTEDALRMTQLMVVNDLEAAALAMGHTSSDHVIPLGPSLPLAGLPIAVVGAGTGLGAATVVPRLDGEVIVLPGEAGHLPLAFTDEGLGAALLRTARREGAPPTFETFVSGPGLVRLYRLACADRGIPALALAPEAICRRALASRDECCLASLEMFRTTLGSLAAAVALATGARGGVAFTGALLVAMLPLLRETEFREVFEANPTMGHYLARIPTVLLTEPYPGLVGALAHLSSASR